MAKIRVYIDGFNLYNGAIRRSGARWLDLNRWCERLAGQPVDRILYCTAMVKSTATDPQKSVRQAGYIQVLKSFSNIEVLLGQFREHQTAHQYADCTAVPACFVKTIKREEKGSDVNLAARLLHDAHRGNYDQAIVVSGDSDLAEPIRLVTQELGLYVTVFNPHGRSKSKELGRVSTRHQAVDVTSLRSCLLPDPFKIDRREYHQPAKWKTPSMSSHQDSVHGQCATCGVDYCSRRFY